MEGVVMLKLEIPVPFNSLRNEEEEADTTEDDADSLLLVNKLLA